MEEKNKNKNNSSIVVLVCLLVAVAVCCGFLIMKQLNKKKTPKTLFTNGIENLFKTSKSEKEVETINSKFSLSFNVESALLEQEILDLINKLTLDGKLAVDIKNSIASIDFSADYDKDNLLDTKAYVKDNSVYMYLNNIYDKWIKADMEDSSKQTLLPEFTINNIEVSPEEVNTIADGLKNAFEKALKDSYFTKEKNDDLTNVTLTITKDNILDIVTDTLNNLKDNSEFKEVAKKVIGVDTEYFIDELLKSVKEVTSNDLKDLSDIKISLYLNNKNETKKLTVDTLIEEQPLKLEVEFADNNSFVVSIYMTGIKFASISVENTIKDDNTRTEVKLSVTGMLDATLNIDSTTKYNEKVDSVDVSNSINANELTETDTNTIMEKIMNNKGIQKIITALENVMPQDELEYDY